MSLLIGEAEGGTGLAGEIKDRLFAELQRRVDGFDADQRRSELTAMADALAGAIIGHVQTRLLDPGKVLTYRGQWSPSVAYNRGDAVIFQGRSYVASARSRGMDPATGLLVPIDPVPPGQVDNGEVDEDAVPVVPEPDPSIDDHVAPPDDNDDAAPPQVPPGEESPPPPVPDAVAPTKWLVLADQGPQGDIGPIGEIGPVGPIGLTGDIGPIGPVGPIGPIGPIGLTGDIGPIGMTGGIGPMGPMGPQGDPGKTINWRGKWSEGVDYVDWDGVDRDGSSYMAIKKNVNIPPPNADVWQVLAQAGTDGTNGTNGTNGVDGAPGPTTDSARLASLIMGSGSDGDVKFAGGAVPTNGQPTLASLNGTTYTLVRDVYAETVLVDGSYTVNLAGYLIHCRGVCNNYGIMETRGNAAVLSTAGAAYTTANTWASSSGAGGAGRLNIPAPSAGLVGGIPPAPSFGAAGGAGGNASTQVGGAGGVPAPPGSAVGTPRHLGLFLMRRLPGGLALSGGGGGGSGGLFIDKSQANSGGGGGGAPLAALICATYDAHGVGTLRSVGGAGGNGAILNNVFGSVPSAGGGGGGGGGPVVLAAGRIISQGTIASLGGAGGIGAGTSPKNGATGAGGSAYVFILQGI